MVDMVNGKELALLQKLELKVRAYKLELEANGTGLGIELTKALTELDQMRRLDQEKQFLEAIYDTFMVKTVETGAGLSRERFITALRQAARMHAVLGPDPDATPHLNGRPLIWSRIGPPQKPTLTAALYVKWYELVLVSPDLSMTSIDFGALEPRAQMGESAYCDHVPNPAVVARLAEFNTWELDPLFAEVLTGRWELEAKG